jgi:hypothetical protein
MATWNDEAMLALDGDVLIDSRELPGERRRLKLG